MFLCTINWQDTYLKMILDITLFMTGVIYKFPAQKR